MRKRVFGSIFLTSLVTLLLTTGCYCWQFTPV